MRAVRNHFPQTPDIPFVAVAHSNRIYQNNKYQNHSGDDLVSVQKNSGVSGPVLGCFVSGDLPRHNGTVVPIPMGTNGLISVIHEPDLGADDTMGIVRQYFAHLTEIDFAAQEHTDDHAGVIGAMLRRADPLKISKVNFSNNNFGIIMPDSDLEYKNLRYLTKER